MQTLTQQAAAVPQLGVLADTATPDEPNIAEWLTFKLGNEEYGIDILSVQEIRSYEKVTRIVNAPPMVKGVINLRGVIVPIVDMRIRFNLETVSYDEFTVVIVLNIGQQIVGMVIDGVSDVVTLEPEQMKQPPALSTGIGVDHILAIGSVDRRTLLLLDIQKLMRSDEMGLLSPTLQ
jgi:purine-binding chemotaxis protein CheW